MCFCMATFLWGFLLSILNCYNCINTHVSHKNNNYSFLQSFQSFVAVKRMFIKYVVQGIKKTNETMPAYLTPRLKIKHYTVKQ